MCSNDEYRKYITSMIGRIENNHDLSQIYTIVRCKFINHEAKRKRGTHEKKNN